MTSERTKDRPIIFRADEVRAIIDGRKTQTRRMVKPQSLFEDKEEIVRRWPNQSGCPYGQPGDRLWVREAWHWIEGNKYGSVLYHADGQEEPRAAPGDWIAPIKPCALSPMVMPRWASRIMLEVTGVRVERLQDINHADAAAEGMCNWGAGKEHMNAGVEFALLWNSINAKRAPWSTNPWVWVVEFKKL